MNVYIAFDQYARKLSVFSSKVLAQEFINSFQSNPLEINDPSDWQLIKRQVNRMNIVTQANNTKKEQQEQL